MRAIRILPENDAALDALHWTGHTGCVMLAPHLVGIRKKQLGLPHVSEATERQRRDGMCWTKEDEPYNGGRAFKAVAAISTASWSRSSPTTTTAIARKK